MRPLGRSLLFGASLAAACWLFHRLLPDPLDAWLEGGAFVTGSVAWWLMVERRRPMSRWNGMSAGAAAGALIFVAIYVAQFVMEEFMGPRGMDPDFALPGIAMVVLSPIAVVIGALVGGSIGFLYHLLACPRPRNATA